MCQRILRITLICSVVASMFCLSASAQSDALPPAPSDTWLVLQSRIASERNLEIVTLDQSDRRRGCRVKSINADRIVCSRAFGRTTIYQRQQIVAVIRPGELALMIELLLGFNSGLGAAIWGSVVLAATCPACAAATSFAAFMFFGAAGAVWYGGGDEPEHLLYLAPGQKLTGKLLSLHP